MKFPDLPFMNRFFYLSCLIDVAEQDINILIAHTRVHAAETTFFDIMTSIMNKI